MARCEDSLPSPLAEDFIAFVPLVKTDRFVDVCGLNMIVDDGVPISL